jgi:hypothetical protein
MTFVQIFIANGIDKIHTLSNESALPILGENRTLPPYPQFWGRIEFKLNLTLIRQVKISLHTYKFSHRLTYTLAIQLQTSYLHPIDYYTKSYLGGVR